MARLERTPIDPPSPSRNGRGKARDEAGEPAVHAAPENREQFIELLERFRGNRSLLAKELGIGRTTLWRKLKELGIEEVYR